MGPFLIAVCLSAFLLFQIQPIIARFILPTFGGGPAIWSACLFFFQAALLLGYLYAHLQVKYVNPTRQVLFHACLLLASVALLPIGFAQFPEWSASSHPALSILLLLAVTIGPLFVLIAASAPLLQHWYARVFPNRSPYRLYALSNFGSLLALLSYPILVEPGLALSDQAEAWSVLYILLALVLIACGLQYRKSNNLIGEDNQENALNKSDPGLSFSDRVRWIALAGCGTILLLSVTNQLTQNVAAVPFLWILPLSLYLISYIISFERDRWYRRWFWWPLAALSIFLLLQDMYAEISTDRGSLAWQIALLCSSLFTGCMICHGELARSRSVASRLTSFYLYVALGGALGGGFVNFLAPVLFNGFWELFLSLLGVVLLAGICWYSARSTDTHRFVSVSFFAAWVLMLISMSYTMSALIRYEQEAAIHITRTFFGVIEIGEERKNTIGHARELFHGNTAHGLQVMHPERRHLPTGYYGRSSGLGESIRHHPKRLSESISQRNLSIGVIGLGTGSTAALTQPGERLRFYEIDPEMETVARDYFHFLELPKADIEIVIGDARITLQQELDTQGSQAFDLLAVDAFSSDSIPVHLLTEEAFQLYQAHLAEDGVLAIHITNLYVDLLPVMHSAATYLGMETVIVTDPGKRWFEYPSEWVVMSHNENLIGTLRTLKSARPWPEKARLQTLRWTDDFSNLFALLEWQN